MKTVIFFANALGDHVLNLPVLRALATRLEDATLLTAPSAGRPLLDELPVGRVVEVPMQVSARMRTFEASTACALLGRIEVDLFVSINPWHSPSVDQLLADLAPRRTIGFDPAYDVALPLDSSVHCIDLAFRAVQALEPCLRVEDYAAPCTVTTEARSFAAAIRDRIGSERRMLVVHAETKPDKQADPFMLGEALARYCTRHPDVAVLVIGRDEPAIVLDRLGPAVIPALGLPLGSSIALVEQADLFLGVDSFPLHVADLSRIPSVGLFGPTRPHEFGFRFTPRASVVDGHGSMTAIRSDPVVQALEVVS